MALALLIRLLASYSEFSRYDQIGVTISSLYCILILIGISVFRHQILSKKSLFLTIFALGGFISFVAMVAHALLSSSVWAFASQLFWISSHITWYLTISLLFALLSYHGDFGNPTVETIVNSSQFVVCIHNTNFSASLEQFKIYRVIPDHEATETGDLRVIDESREDYLYPADYFVPIEVPQSVEQALLRGK